MRWLVVSTCVAVTGLATPVSSSAQGERPVTSAITFGVNGGRFLVGGDDFSGTDDAWGVEGYLGFRTGAGWEGNIGGHYSSHDIGPVRELDIIGIYLEARKYFPSSDSRFEPLLGARGGWVRRDAGTSDSEDLASSGFGVGILGGSVFELASAVQLEALVTANLLSFSAIFGDSSRDDGTTVGMQLGIRFLVPATIRP